MTFIQILNIVNPLMFMLCTLFWMWVANRFRKENFDLLRRIRTIEMWVMLNDHKLNPILSASNFRINPEEAQGE